MFRYNNRATKKHFVSDSDRFELAVSQIAGKRLTYNALIGRELLEKPRPEAFKPRRQNRGKRRVHWSS